jgi:alpha-L-rhamnosidase
MWEVRSGGRDVAQAAYEIEASSDKTFREADLWKSGKVVSEWRPSIRYAGKRLEAGKRAWWRVRVWDRSGSVSPWSSAAQFRVGLLEESDWGGKWIRHSRSAPNIEPANNGFHSTLTPNKDEVRWVEIDLGSEKRLDEVVLHPAKPYDFRPSPGFLFPIRFRIELTDSSGQRQIVHETRADFPNPSEEAASFRFAETRARRVRLEVSTAGMRNEGEFGLALAELEARVGGEVVSRGAAVTSSGAIESGAWSMKRLTDGDVRSHGLIGLDPLPVTELRRNFAAANDVAEATLFAAALGCYRVEVNGSLIDGRFLAPDWTDYHTRVQYQAYDLTPNVRRGENAIRVLLGDGWYAGRLGMAQALDPRGYPRGVYGRLPQFRARLEIRFADGSKETIVTDERWQAAESNEYRSSDLLDGDSVVAFSSPAEWSNAVEGASYEGEIVAQACEPIRLVSELSPLSKERSGEDSWIYDFGQNAAGGFRCVLNGEAGDVVRIRYAEVLNEDGSLYTANLRGAPQVDTIRFKKGGEYEFATLFTYHGYRFVEISGSRREPQNTRSLPFCTSAPIAGTFRCSDPLLNKIWENALWTQRSNLMSVPTDCPQRDERLGWTGDILVFGQTGMFNMDLAAFFTKWLQDMRDSQASDGRFPDFAPHPYGKDRAFTGVPGWGDAGVFCAWEAYVEYGDRELLAAQYPAAKRWIDWIRSKNPDGVWRNARHNDYGDWLNADTFSGRSSGGALDELRKDAFATLMYARSAAIVARMAAALGMSEAADYAALAESVRRAFVATFVDAKGEIVGDTQAGYALALAFLGDGESHAAAWHRSLVRRIEGNGGRISTGFHSTHRLMLELSKRDDAELAYRLALTREFPSWGYTIQNGATTMWERWDGFVKGRGFQDPGMNSFNHWAFGAIGEWMVRVVLGINPLEEHPGYEQFEIAPIPGGGLTFAEGSHLTVRGDIRVSWRIAEGRISLDVTVPVGATAVVRVPRKGDGPVEAPTDLQMTADGYRTPSGSWKFSAPWRA